MSRPVALQVRPEDIPAVLQHERRWCLWRYEHRPGTDRWAKIPCQSTGRYARSNDPTTWAPFDHVLASLSRFDGLGFMLGDGWAGLDLDDCIDGRTVLPAAIPLIAQLDDRYAYQEVSPSGTGYKVIGRAARTGGEIKFSQTPPTCTAWYGARFFAVTGRLPGYGDGPFDPTVDLTAIINLWFPPRRDALGRVAVPTFIRDGDVRGTEAIERLTDDEVIERALATPQAEKFIRLVRGDLSDYGGDHSRADQALVSILAYWCQGDLAQVDRLFRQSGLMRPKWDVASYRRATLAKAVQS